jgi:hypothetical protein
LAPATPPGPPAAVVPPAATWPHAAPRRATRQRRGGATDELTTRALATLRRRTGGLAPRTRVRGRRRGAGTGGGRWRWAVRRLAFAEHVTTGIPVARLNTAPAPGLCRLRRRVGWSEAVARGSGGPPVGLPPARDPK